MDFNLYESFLRTKGTSVFAADQPYVNVKLEDLPKSPIIKAFLDDDDIQEITVCSSSIGFVRTYTKIFKNRNAS